MPPALTADSPARPRPLVDVDMVLRAQGADPRVVRRRSPRLVALAEHAVSIGSALIEPRTACAVRAIEAIRHSRIDLEGGGALNEPVVSHRLTGATEIVALVVTIGAGLEDRVSEVVQREPGLGLALNGFGSAATEALAILACAEVGAEAAGRGLKSTLPMSPGITGWEVARGQRQILDLLEEAGGHLRLTADGVMLPRKSLSMIVGLGRDVTSGDSPCDCCGLRERCRLRPER
jgi:hypothetical protein